MRSAPLLPLLSLVLAGCLSMGHCGPTPTDVTWHEPGFAEALAAADPEGWDVYPEPRPHGFDVEHPALERWNASVHSVSLRERHEVEPGGGPRVDRTHTEANVHLTTPARVAVHVLADRDPQIVRPTVLRFLEALTDANETRREAWADELLAEHDLPEEVDYPAPEHRHFSLLPYELDLPPERLNVQLFLHQHLDPEATLPALRPGNWSVGIDYAETVALREGQEFRASPALNEFRDDAWREEYGDERALEDFRGAYRSLGVGPPPEDATVESVVC